MEYQLLNRVTDLLTAAGLRAGEEYPGGERMEILTPVAAVGLRELDVARGEVQYTVRVLSPRILGGWSCQVWAARAKKVLDEAGMTCTSGEMAYLNGSDCFCVVMAASEIGSFESGAWRPGMRMQVKCSGVIQPGVESFRAVRHQGRRLVGAHGTAGAVVISPGSGGWEVELVQRVDEEPRAVTEPFVLTVREGSRETHYMGCCWNEERFDHSHRGTTLTRRGLALRREVVNG